MVVTSPGSTNHVEGDGGLGRRTVAARDDSWFALVVSGLVVLGAMPFYRYLGPKSTASWCTSFGSGFTCHTHVLSNGFFGIGLGSSAPGMFGNSSPSATTYWVVSIFLGVCLVVGVRRVRLGKMGTVGRIWPIVTIGATTLVLGIASRDWFSVVPSEMTIRGMQSLVLIALGLIVLAVLDHAWGLGLYVVGFLGLALLSCLYNVSNLFSRLGLGSHWPVDDLSLPNLILPGVYLLIGGAGIWVLQHRGIRTNRIKGERVPD